MLTSAELSSELLRKKNQKTDVTEPSISFAIGGLSTRVLWMVESHTVESTARTHQRQRQRQRQSHGGGPALGQAGRFSRLDWWRSWVNGIQGFWGHSVRLRQSDLLYCGFATVSNNLCSSSGMNFLGHLAYIQNLNQL